MMKRISGFGRLWFAGASSSISDSMAEVVIPLIALLVLDASTFQVSLLLAAEQIPWLLIGLPAGAWVDRWPKKVTLVLVNSARALCVLLICGLAFADLLTFALLSVAVTILGVVNIFGSVTSHAVLPEYVASSDLVAANSRLNATTVAGDVFGKAAFTPLIAAVGPVWVFLVDAFWSVVAAIAYVRLPKTLAEERTKLKGSSSLAEEVREGVRFVWSDHTFRVLIMLASATNFLVAAQYGVIYPFLLNDLDTPVALVGILIAASGLGAIAGSAATEWLTRSRTSGKVFRVALCCLGPAAALIPLAAGRPGLLVYVVGSAAFSALIAIVNVLSFSARQASCPADLLGRVTSAGLFLSWGIIPLGLLTGGAIGSALGSRWALVFVAIGFSMLPLLLSRTAIWRQDHLEAKPSR